LEDTRWFQTLCQALPTIHRLPSGKRAILPCAICSKLGLYDAVLLAFGLTVARAGNLGDKPNAPIMPIVIGCLQDNPSRI
jgi:hypothetical protein